MASSTLTNIPSWLDNPKHLDNVLNNPFTSLKNVSSVTSLTDSSAFTSGLRQALYWKKRLAPSTSPFTVIFSILGPKGLMLPSVPEVCQALRNVCNFLNITEIYRASNSHFIGFTFSSTADASNFRSFFTYFANSLVIHVPLSSPFTHQFKLLWLPPAFPDHRIHHFLSKHSTNHHFTRDVIATSSSTHIPTNSVTGTIELSPTTDVQLLPHLIPLPLPHMGHALLIISGRSSFCLRCGQLGHVRRSCHTPRCTSCHRYHLSSSPCPDSDPLLDFSSPDVAPFDEPAVIISSHPDLSTTDPISTIDSNLTHQVTTLSSFSNASAKPSTYILASSVLTTPDSIQSIPHLPPVSTDTSNHPPSPLPIINHELDPSFTLVKHSKRSSASSHIATSVAIHSNSTYPIISKNTMNIFNLLTDDVSTTNNSSLLPHVDTPINVPVFSPSTATTPPTQSAITVSPKTSASTPVPPPCPQSSLSHNHKRFKSSSSQVLSSSSVPPKSASLTSISSWADQAERDVEERDTSPIEICLYVSQLSKHSSTHQASPASSISNSSTSQEACKSPLHPDPYEDYPSLSNTIDKYTPFSLHLFPSSLNTTESHCHYICSSCQSVIDLEWPILDEYLCGACDNQATYSFEHMHLPTPSLFPIILFLSEDHLNHPHNVSYLKSVIDHQILIRMPLA